MLDYSLRPVLLALGAEDILRGLFVQDSHIGLGDDASFAEEAETALGGAVNRLGGGPGPAGAGGGGRVGRRVRNAAAASRGVHPLSGGRGTEGTGRGGTPPGARIRIRGRHKVRSWP